MLDNTIFAMRAVHLTWFSVMLVAVHGIGRKLGGNAAGLVSVAVVGTIPHVFFWSKTIMGEPAMFAIVAVLLFLLMEWGNRLTLLRAMILGAIVGVGSRIPHQILTFAGLFLPWN